MISIISGVSYNVSDLVRRWRHSWYVHRSWLICNRTWRYKLLIAGWVDADVRIEIFRIGHHHQQAIPTVILVYRLFTFRVCNLVQILVFALLLNYVWLTDITSMFLGLTLLLHGFWLAQFVFFFYDTLLKHFHLINLGDKSADFVLLYNILFTDFGSAELEMVHLSLILPSILFRVSNLFQTVKSIWELFWHCLKLVLFYLKLIWKLVEAP